MIRNFKELSTELKTFITELPAEETVMSYETMERITIQVQREQTNYGLSFQDVRNSVVKLLTDLQKPCFTEDRKDYVSDEAFYTVINLSTKMSMITHAIDSLIYGGY